MLTNHGSETDCPIELTTELIVLTHNMPILAARETPIIEKPLLRAVAVLI
jgi:hypothetical protein